MSRGAGSIIATISWAASCSHLAPWRNGTRLVIGRRGGGGGMCLFAWCWPAGMCMRGNTEDTITIQRGTANRVAGEGGTGLLSSPSGAKMWPFRRKAG